MKRVLAVPLFLSLLPNPSVAARAGAAADWAEDPHHIFEEHVARGLEDFSRGAFKPAPLAARETVAESSGGSPDYCIASFSSAEEGAPKFWFRISCPNQAPLSSPSRWCWTFKESKHRECVGRIVEDLQALMWGKGYEDVGRFKNGGDFDYYYLFRRSGTILDLENGYCLAHRVPVWRSGFGGLARIDYRIDCGDNALTNLKDAEPDLEGTSGIAEYMRKAGYALSGSLDDKKGFRKLIFRRR